MKKTASGRQVLNSNVLATSPSRDRLVVVYHYRNRLDFFDGEGIRYGTDYGPREARARCMPSARNASGEFPWDPKSQVGYVAVAATADYVYALYCGCARTEMAKPTPLHIFRWNGDFVGELVIDRYITALAVSEGDSLLYGAIGATRSQQLGEWHLPVWLNSEAEYLRQHEGENLTGWPVANSSVGQ